MLVSSFLYSRKRNFRRVKAGSYFSFEIPNNSFSKFYLAIISLLDNYFDREVVWGDRKLLVSGVMNHLDVKWFSFVILRF